MRKEFSPSMMLACVCAAVLFPMSAHASFNGGPCRDFACHFLMMGILVGVIGGIPISVLIFLALHLGLCNRGRSKRNQALLGGLIGIVAFEASALAAALVAAWAKPTVGYHENYALLGFAPVYLLFAGISGLFARSSPRR
jgi:uncharacterized BrkB/YihY/UPF0761 family membrane protein